MTKTAAQPKTIGELEAQAQTDGPFAEIKRLLVINADLLAALEDTTAWLGALIDAAPTNNTAQTKEYKERLGKFAKAAGVKHIGTIALQNARAAIAKAEGRP